ncbi:KICSTOR complex protein kaptin [Cephus cinctus]|uniref:KICSTOR complex protein kaptin n=1 Tax=Cephus cinctus TaxID=211228 RepID=A0AAJ7BT46_CEPCN|nr:KICSTOR complex protein kaptin [Cephus cinctus]XP_015593631.1 KICSTOR complex protein kaptin [Cephus cinctus]XP_015593632.1 KICSTOR complex protein kaptin [Cephus cinctus]XP_015593634.1 KICSTOR complex protein kaptin [Cephus cinctus]XP_015593635.1 KICSTOR complex protein kaptin [Cephus cinctus]XP_015593636.1 KICSTOR complex protein kaptin [Cephus cinctus]
MENVIDAHWFSLASQGNIYSMTKLCSNNCNKVLVASLKRKIYTCEYHRTPKQSLRPLVKELLFTYIPSGAEIVAIDAYNKSETGNEFVIGITILKPSGETSVERYLNIYTEGEGDGEGDESSSIEAIAQNCLMVELSYTPYQLYHTVIPHKDLSNEIVWLLSGSDFEVHMIREDRGSHGYAESAIENYFPELSNLLAIALCIDIYYYKNFTRRITVVGCECGLVKIAIMNVEELKVIESWVLRYDNPISSVKIFPHENTVSKPAFFNSEDKDIDSVDDEKEPILNILLVNSVNPSVVFMNILHRGVSEDVTLAGSELSDCVVCSCIADINMDGRNEILLGTYGQEILVYTLNDGNWDLTEKRLFEAPVHSICYMDLTGDGMKELVVLTQRGVHILQHDPRDVKRKWVERLRKIMATRSEH